MAVPNAFAAKTATIPLSELDANFDYLTETPTLEGIVLGTKSPIVTTPETPASASATGVIGTIAWDTNYIYICVATNTWKRIGISTW